MKRLLGLAFLALVVVLPARLRADGELTGNWKLTTLVPNGNQDTTNWVFGLETTDGNTTAKLVAANPSFQTPALTSFKRTGDHVRVEVQYTIAKQKVTAKQVFEGHLTKDGKKIVGVLNQAIPACMATTGLKELDPTDITRKLPEDELLSWAEATQQLAEKHKAPWAVQVNTLFAEVFLTRKNAAQAVVHAVAADKALTDKSSLDLQEKVLGILSRALKSAGKEAELKVVTERLAKVDVALDEDYLAKVPPFKPDPYTGRQGQSKRVAVMELFTGAQCGPCVASDVAFDAMQKTFNRGELVLLQYHLHIPGPDPMTNPASEARWTYYRDGFGKDTVGGTPTVVFSGIAQRSAGGSMATSEKMYLSYRKLVTPVLETPAGCEIKVSAKRTGDRIDIQTDVAGLENPGEKVKLRIVLAEENIRYVGSNKIRFHHQVVRAMPGGADGVAVMRATLQTKNEVSLDTLKKDLVSYLDNFALKRPFPRPDRPLSLEHLRVIAFVQDDASHQILQAVQAEVAQ